MREEHGIPSGFYSKTVESAAFNGTEPVHDGTSRVIRLASKRQRPFEYKGELTVARSIYLVAPPLLK